MEKKITIAIDGHSSCGKSTMAKALARRIGYIYVDTGAMYRAVTLLALRNNLFDNNGNVDSQSLSALLPKVDIKFQLDPSTSKPHTLLSGEDVESEIRSMNVSQHVSKVAELADVRQFLVAQQQAMGKDKGIVMDGRDIGTAVFPDAELKIFVTASAEVRATRRYDELKQKGQEACFEDIKANIEQRDYLDSHREVSPLRQAPDALLLDNSHMTIEEQDQWLFDAYQHACK